MINPYYYNSLPLEDKAEMLCHQGDLIVAVATNEYDVSLYILDGEYIELYYSISCNRISEIKIIQDHKRLEFYAQNIDLDQLFD
jgi:hypothetical protein